jgi:hypothetical protein
VDFENTLFQLLHMRNPAVLVFTVLITLGTAARPTYRSNRITSLKKIGERTVYRDSQVTCNFSPPSGGKQNMKLGPSIFGNGPTCNPNKLVLWVKMVESTKALPKDATLCQSTYYPFKHT